jgi:hypothetical protein
MKWWDRYLRHLDQKLLWPTCKEMARDLDQARAAFTLHTKLDPAWREVTEEERTAIVNKLR